MTTTDHRLDELGKDVGKILEIVSTLVEDNKTMKKDISGMKEDILGMKEDIATMQEDISTMQIKLDTVISHSMENTNWNKEQDKRLDRVDHHLHLPALAA
ncbi:hypothetical protein C5B42_03170 [Candidatus Cerribacteria bacterium 'Amazon FNV 2010 28 9']|uniref:Uncharacterized protein n=1 Tax=Candidatus Cerribacteria bacterium 'Amazon FNV 2010 28 9' TaxID=2081795 RepID=A0A317JPU3_9BACT|nr:MAG: hypothetical protein C5B42_03170 [Candidatus Cerribacteria bacterium 'Amazon FNV 2010 28 9']